MLADLERGGASWAAEPLGRDPEEEAAVDCSGCTIGCASTGVSGGVGERGDVADFGGVGALDSSSS